MRGIPRQALIGALIFFLLSTACEFVTQAFTPARETAQPAGTAAASATPAGVSVTPLVPITGESVAYMQCQFCVAEETHAVLIFPDFAYFDVVMSSSVSCLTADVVNGKRILICRGPQSTSFDLNICSDSSNCLQFPVFLQPCELLQGQPAAPVYLTPERSPRSDDDTEPAQPANPNPPAHPQPSAEPTSAPPPTNGGSGGGEEKKDVTICHIPPGNPDKRKTMTVSQSSWENEHSEHGDTLGACS